jgi:prepilin-type N-terminal cleavage/methylation domain-containing protein
MTRKKGTCFRREKKGYTLVEMLVVVAILVILLGVALISILTIQKQLRQKELDSKAETIYVAAQRRMAELCASGYEDLYQYTEGSNRGISKVGLVPYDADGDTQMTEDTLCYVEAAKGAADDGTISLAAADILPEGTVDEELRSNQWHVEFDPETGCVYGVFYSEKGEIPSDKNSLDDLRSKKQRLKNGAWVGYYGGDLTQTDSTDTLYPGITIENKEELKAIFYCNNPSSTEELTFKITLTDANGHTYEKTIEHASLERVSSRIYRYTWTLDSLKSEKSRFYAQTEGKLDCGTELTIKLSVSSSDKLVDTAEVESKTNSLFDYRKDSDSDTALISYARHLQNLDENSHVTSKITKAIQTSDISFADNESDDNDWYSLYGEDSFTPIENDNLTSYNGQSDLDGTKLNTSIYSLHIANKSGKEAGLFKTFGNKKTTSEIKNVTLTGTKIEKGSSVGALIGKADGAVSLENCSVYLSSKQGDLEDLKTVDEAEDVTPWIKGTTVGGLIGSSSADVTIKNSFASTVLKGSSIAGGLIGQIGGKVSADTVYADSYILAPQTGGLFGDTTSKADISIENFYAVGYQVGSSTEAGIVPDALTSAKNGYCAVDFATGSDITTYSTAKSGSLSKVYYLTGSKDLSGSSHKTYKELSENGVSLLGSDHFTANSGGASYPYNLMNQGLSTYSYPRLSELDHYGDWKAEFESGKLVYYEKYSDGTYAFEGANVSTLTSSKTVVGDGYALAYTKDTLPTDGTSVELTYGKNSTKKSLTIDSSSMATVSNNGETYYLQALPTAVVNPSLDGAVESFYQKITVTSDGTENSYYYNPYFAKTVTENDKTPDAPSMISVRSPRQLYALSLYYKKYADETKNSVYSQELSLDYTSYEWKNYTNWGNISTQEPIDAENGFIANYNGGYHSISGLSITSSQAATGLFGTIGSSGIVRNLYLTGRVGTEKVSRTIGTGLDNVASGSRNSSQIGALAGINKGTIANCAVSGYNMTYYGYNSNTAYIGGMVGENRGTIRSSSSDAAGIALTSNSAYAYIGGMVGRNSGSIVSSYATGLIRVLQARSSTVWTAGFVGNNIDGTTNRCYSATALTAAGTAEVYGFGRIGGSAVDCYYLDGGTYAYAGNIYAYNTSSNEYASKAVGSKKTGDELKNLSLRDFGQATAAYKHDETSENVYSYPSVVNMNGKKVHIGNWPVQQYIGTTGIFYWEYESYGSNSGYHISYIGYNDGEQISGSTLCTQHDDGGVITAYGYGYFYKDGTSTPTLSKTNCNLGSENIDAGKALHAQMSDYQFVAYETGEGNSKLHMSSSSAVANSTWTLSAKETDGTSMVYTFTLNPFFADTMSFDSIKIGSQSTQNLSSATPGTESKVYQIRSTQQLQFINWNYNASTATKSVTNTSSNYQYYTYLSYLGYRNSSNNYTATRSYVWNQSHDLDASLDGSAESFTPIGGLYDNSGTGTDTAQIYGAYFSSVYNGEDYTIKNIEISSTAQCIGLFGFTSGADMQNIVLYSDKEGGSSIINEAGGSNWYAVGGLVGFAGSANKSSSVFKNCTVSGYNIIDNQKGYPGWGGGCVGGLVGATNMAIEGCTAVTDITINIGYTNSYTNLRVGGIAGVSRGSFDSCYAGGSIVSTSNVGSGGPASNASIWAGGICGGIVLRYQGNISSLVGNVTNVLKVNNCYSYVKMPASGSTGANNVRNSQSIASNGELQCTSYGAITNSYIEIYNSYAYADNVTGCDDYKQYKNSTSWNGNGVKFNVGNNSSNGNSTRGITIYNSYSPYLTYDQMSDGTLLTYLSTGSSKFGTVTTTENGVAIDGKYSFPGNEAELKGSNYPFPTVLTQTDIFGNTVNVHYGEWPKYGIYWEESSFDFDLFANRQTATSGASAGEELSLLKVKLRIYGTADDTLTADDITFTDDEGEALTDSPLEVYEISGLQKDETSSYYEVTFKGLKSGNAFVHATLGSGDDQKEAEMTVNVTSDMSIKGNDGKVTLRAGEEQTVDLTFYTNDTDGNETQLIPEKSKLSWKVAIKSGEDYVICDDDSVSYDESSGKLTVTLTGKNIESLSEADAHISISCTYQYGSGEEEKLEKSADIMVSVESPDFAYLSYGDDNSGYRFLYQYTKSDLTQIGQIAASFSGNGIVIRNNYANLGMPSMSDFSLEVDGNSYGSDANGDIYRGSELLAHIALGDATSDTTNGYTSYPLTVSGYSLTSNATLKLKLRSDVVLSVMIPGVTSSTDDTGADTPSNDTGSDSSGEENSVNANGNAGGANASPSNASNSSNKISKADE